MYPKVHAATTCEILGRTWHAWVVEQAKPLDKILSENPAVCNVCIPGAVRAMRIAHSNHHILSDNALFNFGMVDGNVVIIDAGSRFSEPKLIRSQFNRKVMKQFWSKAKTVIHPRTLELYMKEWREAGHDMVTALQTYQTRWQEIRNDTHSLSVLNSLQDRNFTKAECPHVASLMDSLDTGILNRLTKTYLWGNVAEYGRSSDGYTRQQDSSYTAAQKLEQFISETHG